MGPSGTAVVVNRAGSCAEVPDDLLCPVLQTVMRDPVVNLAGNTYDRVALQRITTRVCGRCVDPLTNEILSHSILIPNWDMRRRVQSFLDMHPGYVPDGWPDRRMPLPASPTIPVDGCVICEGLVVMIVICLSFVVTFNALDRGGGYGVQELKGTSFSLEEELADAPATGVGPNDWVSNGGSWRPALFIVGGLSNIPRLVVDRRSLVLQSWSVAFLCALLSYIGLAMMEFSLVLYIVPRAVMSRLALGGTSLMIAPAAADLAYDMTQLRHRYQRVKFLFSLLQSLGGMLLCLGLVAWRFPAFASSPTTLAGSILLSVAKAFQNMNWHMEGVIQRFVWTLFGCSGFAWICFGAIVDWNLSLALNSLALSGATLSVIGASASEAGHDRVQSISLSGAMMLIICVAASAVCRR
ncbi:unnamed protein product [Prorocentrum cordatum]|uniref:U-box domain-containing protein n=1 Tax=Prorocentrum cordatum TaxID=2364126 RepID=A0ABN9XAW9_9DINO|nr:unnamed protein product [Polarella glacialis]